MGLSFPESTETMRDTMDQAITDHLSRCIDPLPVGSRERRKAMIDATGDTVAVALQYACEGSLTASVPGLQPDEMERHILQMSIAATQCMADYVKKNFSEPKSRRN